MSLRRLVERLRIEWHVLRCHVRQHLGCGIVGHAWEYFYGPNSWRPYDAGANFRWCPFCFRKQKKIFLAGAVVWKGVEQFETRHTDNTDNTEDAA